MIAKLQSNNFRCFFLHFYYLLYCSNMIFVKKFFTYEFQLIYASHGHATSSYKNLTKIFFLLDETTKIYAIGELVEGKLQL